MVTTGNANVSNGNNRNISAINSDRGGCGGGGPIRKRWLLGTFFVLALLVIILETHCCQAVKLNC